MFARPPGGEWVADDDSPDKTYAALGARQERWRKNGAIDDIFDALNKKEALGSIWRAPSFAPCDLGVRVNLERIDNGSIVAIEFSLDDPNARRAVQLQLATIFQVEAAA